MPRSQALLVFRKAICFKVLDFEAWKNAYIITCKNPLSNAFVTFQNKSRTHTLWVIIKLFQSRHSGWHWSLYCRCIEPGIAKVDVLQWQSCSNYSRKNCKRSKENLLFVILYEKRIWISIDRRVSEKTVCRWAVLKNTSRIICRITTRWYNLSLYLYSLELMLTIF